MSNLKTPVICIVTGEAGSGGALAIGVGDRVIMLQYSVYAVISPEGCASILWKDAGKASEAARAMGVTASDVYKNGLVDDLIEEPLGGAHRNPAEVMTRLEGVIAHELKTLRALPLEQLLADRYNKFMAIGACA